MSLVQRIMKAVLPKQLADDLEAESRQWFLRCPDGHKISAWDAGAIRFGGHGKPKRFFRCPDCGRLRLMEYEKSEAGQ